MNGLYVIPVVIVSAVIVAFALSYDADPEPTVTSLPEPTDTTPEPIITTTPEPTDTTPEPIITTTPEPTDTTPEPIITANTDDLNRLVDTNNQFAIDLYSKASYSDPDNKNVFFSPWSIFNAFIIAFEGAEGKAYDELQDVFGFITNDTQRRTAFKFINNDLNQRDAEYKLAIANALWLQQGKSIYPQYIDIAETYYDSTVDTVNLESQEGVDLVNKWADENTNGKIKKIINNPLTDPLLVITNAVYFKGSWDIQFKEKNTHDADFWLDSNNHTTTPMMSLDGYYFNYTHADGIQILELPYKGDKISMLILLPDDRDGIMSLENSLTKDSLDTWRNELHFTKVNVTIPKFTMETEYGLIPLLKSLGLEQPFREDFNFAKIHDQNHTWIKVAAHKAFVDVNEEGTEAVAVTGVVVVATSAPQEFTADHPFMFIIQDTQTGHILFIGKIADPTPQS